MSSFAQRHRALVGLGGAAIALVVAVVYFFVVPGEAREADGLARVILLYGHSLVWILLAGTGVAFARSAPKKLVGALAWAALVVYAVFLATLLLLGPLGI